MCTERRKEISLLHGTDKFCQSVKIITSLVPDTYICPHIDHLKRERKKSFIPVRNNIAKARIYILDHVTITHRFEEDMFSLSDPLVCFQAC
jgi:hypothetical protein